MLKLISNKAEKKLGWKTILTIKEVIYLIYDWYFTFSKSKKNIFKKTLEQIEDYEKKRFR